MAVSIGRKATAMIVERGRWESLGYRVIRFRNDEVMFRTQDVLAEILQVIEKRISKT